MTPGIYMNGAMIRPPTVYMGNVSRPAFQMTKGEVGSIAHELNHVIEDFEGFPLAMPYGQAGAMPLQNIKYIVSHPATSPADKAYYTAMGKEFSDTYKKNPGRVEHALYLHNSSEAMSRLASLMTAHPELRSHFPLDLLDVRDDWMFSTYKPKNGPHVMNQDPQVALDIAKWAVSPEGMNAMDAISKGTAYNVSREPLDIVTSLTNAAKGTEP